MMDIHYPFAPFCNKMKVLWVRWVVLSLHPFDFRDPELKAI